MTKIIGLTGGIGSGKTTIANHLNSLGIPLFIADDEAKKIMQFPEVITKIENVFGTTVFDEGILNRQKLAAIVFSDSEKLNQLNSIIHPEVRKKFKHWLNQYQNEPFVVYEAAILFESGSYKICDYIITITAPLEERIERVTKRDKISRIEIVERINAQWSDTQRALKSNFIIENTSIEKAKTEINKILKNLKN